MDYSTIKNYYEMGLFYPKDIAVFVQAGYLVQEQADEITGGNL